MKYFPLTIFKSPFHSGTTFKFQWKFPTLNSLLLPHAHLRSKVGLLLKASHAAKCRRRNGGNLGPKLLRHTLGFFQASLRFRNQIVKFQTDPLVTPPVGQPEAMGLNCVADHVAHPATPNKGSFDRRDVDRSEDVSSAVEVSRPANIQTTLLPSHT